MERQVGVVQKSITVSPSQSIRIGGHRLSLPQIQKGRQINLVSCVASNTVNIFSSLSTALRIIDKLLDSDL